jgi:hypothetical protein
LRERKKKWFMEDIIERYLVVEDRKWNVKPLNYFFPPRFLKNCKEMAM